MLADEDVETAVPSVRTSIEPCDVTPPAAAPDALLGRAAALAGYGAWECELATGRLRWTDGVYDLFGLPQGYPMLRSEALTFYHEECRAVMERLRAEAIACGTSFRIDARIRRTDGVQRWMRLTGNVVRENGRAVRLFGMKQDVTAERAAWEVLRRQAQHDPLTGLHNRAVFQERFLDRPHADPELRPLGALLLVDVDGFKQVNDRHGHLAGDQCLRMTAELLTACFPDALLIARIGGDEFALALPATVSPVAVQARIDLLLRRLAGPIGWGEQVLRIGASLGVAMLDDPQVCDAQALYAAADRALYAAKAGGRNRYRIAPGTDDPARSAMAAG